MSPPEEGGNKVGGLLILRKRRPAKECSVATFSLAGRSEDIEVKIALK